MFSIYFFFSTHILWCYLLFTSFILYVHVPYAPFTECFCMPGSSKYFLYSCEFNKFEFSISLPPARSQRSMNGFGWTFSELELHTRIGSVIVIFVRYLSSFLNTPELKKKKKYFLKIRRTDKNIWFLKFALLLYWLGVSKEIENYTCNDRSMIFTLWTFNYHHIWFFAN